MRNGIQHSTYDRFDTEKPLAMSTTDVAEFFDACLGDLVCKHLYDQELMPNSTRFDVIARTLIPAWPVSFAHVQAIVAEPDALRSMYLVSNAASNECGFNRWSPNGQCVFIAPFERPSAVFVNVVFVVFILIALISGATYFAKMAQATHDAQRKRKVVRRDETELKEQPRRSQIPPGGGEVVLAVVKNGEYFVLQNFGVIGANTNGEPDSAPLQTPDGVPKPQPSTTQMLVQSHGIEHALGLLRGRVR
jgi:hypothetical protein